MTMLEERVSSIEGAYDHLATKADLQELRGDLNTAVEELRGDLNTAVERLRGDLRTEMETIRGDLVAQMRATEIRTIKWVAGLMVGTALGTVTAIAALLRIFLQ